MSKCKKCSREVSCKGLCNWHYSQKYRWENGHTKKRTLCQNMGCNNYAENDICAKCAILIKRAENKKDYNPHINMVGNKNPRWKGGKSQYPNHYLFKINGKTEKIQAKQKCRLCDEKAKHIHHIDGTKTNHDIKNLLAVCVKCHSLLHKRLTGQK